MDKTIDERLAHTDPDENNCDFTRNPPNISGAAQTARNPNILAKYLGIEIPTYIGKNGKELRADCAHTCGNGIGSIGNGYSTAPFVCSNPEHLYFATRSENQKDRPRHGSLFYGDKNTTMLNQPFRIEVEAVMFTGEIIYAKSLNHLGRILSGDKVVTYESRKIAVAMLYMYRNGTSSKKYGILCVRKRT